ncbi:MAG: type III-A CRISPR-associated protein Cas10/Csm1 [Microscillaceae bacterium]|nr:type III-A CRISPR-associated protein Cas10/Csm1 [Microscillaceae bacterium]
MKIVENLQAKFEKAQAYTCGGSAHKSDEKQLRSIFDGLAGNPKQGYYFEPRELTLNPFNFPNKDKKGAIEDVFDNFSEQYKQIKDFQNKAFAETCLALLEKHFCYVPCGIKGLEDVSLYDYIKSIAGFMVCLQNIDENESEPILLIGGDVSGIQAFIYDIISTDASKNLKGRSFYLQLLVDSVLKLVLKELGLFSANIIYASGGGFYLIAPNTKDNIQKIGNLEKTISQKVYETHKTAFSISLGYVSIKKATILTHNLIVNPEAKPEDQNTVRDVLMQVINNQQKQKFKHQILNNFDDFFGKNGIEVGGNQERDAISGEEFEDNEKKYPVDKDDPSRAEKIKKTTQEQIELGKELRDFEFLVSSHNPIEIIGNPRSINFYNPCELGVYYCFMTDKELSKLNFGGNSIHIHCINKIEDHLLAYFLNSPHTYTFSFYGGNDYPTIKVKNKKGYEFDPPKTFSELAGQKDEEDNRKYVNEFKEPQYKRLGILRMDVDGLGAVFSAGGLTSFAQYSVLSRSLDYFFKGYLNMIWENNPNFKEYTQIIYSGGDDLFIIGRWDYLIEFAEQIQKDFEKWTCGNEKLGISGGMSVVPPKYPIAKAAKQSEEFEKASKNHQFPDKEELKKTNPIKDPDWEKNSICFFDENMPLHWKFEYPIVKDLKKQLQEFVAKTNNNSILQRIQAFNLQRKVQQDKNNPKTESWRWLLAYDFARFRDRVKGKNLTDIEIKMLKEQVNQYKTNIFCNTYQGNPIKNISKYYFIELLAFAARWAELENRTRGKSEESS